MASCFLRFAIYKCVLLYFCFITTKTLSFKIWIFFILQNPQNNFVINMIIVFIEYVGSKKLLLFKKCSLLVRISFMLSNCIIWNITLLQALNKDIKNRGFFSVKRCGGCVCKILICSIAVYDDVTNINGYIYHYSLWYQGILWTL